MPVRQFMILMLLGRLPGVFVSVWVGANVAHIDPGWWIAFFAAIAIAALVIWRWGAQLQDRVLDAIESLSDRFNS
jgi:uncharacterized membrane protein YdjX (TVP38/TMEM64 family)